MNLKISNYERCKDQEFILAIHSSSETLGLAAMNYLDQEKKPKVSIFKIGRQLSNKIVSCVEEIIPSQNWKKIVRLGVSIGPGGFTSTRLGVAMARTLAQQINCNLDGISSFQLMAPRLINKALEHENQYKPFWITKEINRRGLIGGKYKLKHDIRDDLGEFIELQKPSLLKVENNKFDPSIFADDDVRNDVLQLLKISYSYHKIDKISPWELVKPIYCSSPVGEMIKE